MKSKLILAYSACFDPTRLGDECILQQISVVLDQMSRTGDMHISLWETLLKYQSKCKQVCQEQAVYDVCKTSAILSSLDVLKMTGRMPNILKAITHDGISYTNINFNFRNSTRINSVYRIWKKSLQNCGYYSLFPIPLQWRHNNHDCVSNHQPHGCLLNRFFRRRSKKTSKLRVTGLCMGNSPGPVNSPHKGPVTRKCFHLMTSSWKVGMDWYCNPHTPSPHGRGIMKKINVWSLMSVFNRHLTHCHAITKPMMIHTTGAFMHVTCWVVGRKRIGNFIPHLLINVITYPCKPQ